LGSLVGAARASGWGLSRVLVVAQEQGGDADDADGRESAEDHG
jgi:hypothetical protein